MKNALREFPVAQWVKDLALTLQWLRSLLWLGFDPCPGKFHMPLAQPKKKNKKKNQKKKTVIFLQTLINFMCIKLGVRKGKDTGVDRKKL